MSYNLAGIAAKAEKEKVYDAYREILGDMGGEVAKIEEEAFTSKQPGYFKLCHSGEWTIIAYPYCGLAVGLSEQLAKRLSTKVISIDENETTGYKHFSIYEGDRLEVKFTYLDGVKDKDNVDFEKLYEMYVESGEFVNPPPGEPSDQAKVDRAFDALNYCVAEVNVEQMVLDCLDRGDAYRFEYQGPTLAGDSAKLGDAAKQASLDS